MMQERHFTIKNDIIYDISFNLLRFVIPIKRSFGDCSLPNYFISSLNDCCKRKMTSENDYLVSSRLVWPQIIQNWHTWPHSFTLNTSTSSWLAVVCTAGANHYTCSRMQNILDYVYWLSDWRNSRLLTLFGLLPNYWLVINSTNS